MAQHRYAVIMWFIIVGNTNISLHYDCNVKDQLQACYQAEIIEYAIGQAGLGRMPYDLAIANIVEAIKHGKLQEWMKNYIVMSSDFVKHTEEYL